MHTSRTTFSCLLLLLCLLLSLPGTSAAALAPSNPWTVYETVPNFSDGNSHVLWIKPGTTDAQGNYSGDTVSIWTTDVYGHEMAISPTYGPYPGWHVYEMVPGFDGTLRMAWTKTSGTAASGFSSVVSLWTLDGSGSRTAISPTYGPYLGWVMVEAFANPDTTTTLYWEKFTADDGTTLPGSQVSIWTVDSVGSQLAISPTYGPYPGWQFRGGLPSLNKDGTSFLTWIKSGAYDSANAYSGDQLSIWKTDTRGNRTSISPTYGPYAGWNFQELYPAYDGTARLLWIQPGTVSSGASGTQTGDIASVWSVDRLGTQTAISPTYGPYDGWTVDSIAAAPSSTSRLLWIHAGTYDSSSNYSGDQASIWALNTADVRTSISPTYTAPGGSTKGLFVRPDGSENLNWEFGSSAASNYNGTQFSLWDLNASDQLSGTGPAYGPYY